MLTRIIIPVLWKESITGVLNQLPLYPFLKLQEYLRFKQKKGWTRLAVYKSGIHALGLYTKKFIAEGEVVRSSCCFYSRSVVNFLSKVWGNEVFLQPPVVAQDVPFLPDLERSCWRAYGWNLGPEFNFIDSHQKFKLSAKILHMLQQ